MFALAARSLLSSLLLASTTSIANARLTHKTRASVCNGHAELCSRSFGNVSFVGAHDSYASLVGNPASNQDYNITTQLNEGVRMLQVQIHNNNGVPHLCHTSCTLLDAGPFVNYLSTVKTWLDSNPNEVISILIVDSDSLGAAKYADLYKSSGLDALSYAPSQATLQASAWPSLGELIDTGKRAVTFLNYNADFTVAPYLIDEFSNMWETAFDVTDQTFNCSVNRGSPPDGKLYTINHFLDTQINVLGISFPVPDKGNLSQTNAVQGTGSLGLQAATCAGQWSRAPNFMLVDYYNWGTPPGSVFQVAANLNGLQYTGSVSPPITSSSSSKSSSSSSSSSTPMVSFIPDNSARGRSTSVGTSRLYLTASAVGMGLMFGVSILAL